MNIKIYPSVRPSVLRSKMHSSCKASVFCVCKVKAVRYRVLQFSAADVHRALGDDDDGIAIVRASVWLAGGCGNILNYFYGFT